MAPAPGPYKGPPNGDKPSLSLNGVSNNTFTSFAITGASNQAAAAPQAASSTIIPQVPGQPSLGQSQPASHSSMQYIYGAGNANMPTDLSSHTAASQPRLGQVNASPRGPRAMAPSAMPALPHQVTQTMQGAPHLSFPGAPQPAAAAQACEPKPSDLRFETLADAVKFFVQDKKVPLILSNGLTDDLRAVGYLKFQAIKNIMAALNYNKHMPAPTHFLVGGAELGEKMTKYWNDYQLNASADLNNFLDTRYSKDEEREAYIEYKAMAIFQALIDLHETGWDPDAKAVDDTLICSKRLEAVLRAIKWYAKIRRDLIKEKHGGWVEQLVASPVFHVKSKVDSMKDNGRKADGYMGKKPKRGVGQARKRKPAVPMDYTGREVSVLDGRLDSIDQKGGRTASSAAPTATQQTGRGDGRVGEATVGGQSAFEGTNRMQQSLTDQETTADSAAEYEGDTGSQLGGRRHKKKEVGADAENDNESEEEPGEDAELDDMVETEEQMLMQAMRNSLAYGRSSQANTAGLQPGAFSGGMSGNGQSVQQMMQPRQAGGMAQQQPTGGDSWGSMTHYGMQSPGQILPTEENDSIQAHRLWQRYSSHDLTQYDPNGGLNQNGYFQDNHYQSNYFQTAYDQNGGAIVDGSSHGGVQAPSQPMFESISNAPIQSKRKRSSKSSSGMVKRQKRSIDVTYTSAGQEDSAQDPLYQPFDGSLPQAEPVTFGGPDSALLFEPQVNPNIGPNLDGMPPPNSFNL